MLKKVSCLLGSEEAGQGDQVDGLENLSMKMAMLVMLSAARRLVRKTTPIWDHGGDGTGGG